MEKNQFIYNEQYEGMEGIVLESRGGSKNSDNYRNPDYKLLRQYILNILQQTNETEVEIYIASRNSTYKNLSERLICINNTTKFDFNKIDIEEFKKKLNEAVSLKGQKPGAKGGNDTKKLFFKTKYSFQKVNQNKIRIHTEAKLDDTKEDIQLEKILNEFIFDFNRPQNNSSELKLIVNNLQEELFQFISSKLPSYNWKKEYMPSSLRKDSIDIYGFNHNENKSIVIELDPHRADSIAKKFVSRIALLKDENVSYIAFLYPGTEKMPKNEAIKYCNDCTEIANIMSNSNSTKEFLGYFFN
ncbi:hypothetical protein [Empedobacter falsenii]